MNPVSYSREDNIAVIRINNPPVNALSHAVRAGVVTSLEQARQDQVTGILLLCEGRTFMAGADITEFGKPPQEPSLRAMHEALEAHPAVTVAVIHGTALGGGLETALCCDYRCAVASAKLGLPEVKLGLLPGAGGTQRTPRLIGVKAAIELTTTGDPVNAQKACDMGLIDRVIEGDLLEQGRLFLQELLSAQTPKRPARALSVTLSDDDKASIAQSRLQLLKKTRGEHAPQRILDCIEAAEMPFDEGMQRERDLFEQCMADPQSAALRHMFFAERQAAKIEGIDPNIAPREIKTVGIIGAGTMGGGIAMCFAQAGIPVTLLDMNPEAVQTGIERIAKNYAISMQKGRFSESWVDEVMNRITPSSAYDDLAGCDLVIEAVFENLGVKQAVFKELDRVCHAKAILATNTSYQSIDEIAAVTSRPEDVVGMHFFSPANVMKLLEVVKGAQTAPDVIKTAMGIGKVIGKVPVLAGMCYGFIGNRMLKPYVREAQLCLIEGATPAQVDRAMEQWGMAMGPIAVGDLAGLDIGYKAREQLTEAQKGDKAGYIVADRLVEAGRLGQKSGAGFYRYDANTRARTEDPEVLAIIADCAAELGIAQRVISDDEIIDRLTLALANEGAKIVAEGIAQRASDVDVVYCYGYGFPRFRGGPLFAIEQRGLADAVSRMRDFAARLSTKNWEIAPLLESLAESQGSLQNWNKHD
jgi:3-hydroxyacyl-CoA dehydrogenase